MGTRPTLGIDITSTGVKILEISGTNNALCVENYGVIPLPVDAMDGIYIKDIDAVAHSIKKLVNQLGIQGARAVLAMPDSIVINIIVPFYDGLTDDEIEELIILEAEKLFSHSIDELNFDFEILGPSKKNPTMIDVLVVAARTTQINERITAVNRAGLDVQIMEVESYAMERVSQQLIQHFPFHTVAMMDISSESLRLHILQETKLIYSREKIFSGAAQLSGSFEEVILLQIQRALHFFYSVHQDETIDHIFVAGDLVHPQFLLLIQSQQGISTTLANPFSSMAIGEKISSDALYRNASAWMLACGLALRNID